MISNTNSIKFNNIDNTTDNNKNIKMPKITLKAQELQKEILDYFEEHKYQLKTDIKTITAKNNSLNYICVCGQEKHKSYKDMLLKGCRGCNALQLKEKPTIDDINICPSDDKDEKWAPIEGGFVSNKGRACNVYGKILTADERNRYYLAGKLQYISILIAKAFEVEGIDKLEGQKSNAIVRVKDKDNITLDNIYVGTRNEIGAIYGKKSRSSDDFKENMNRDLFKHMEEFKYVSVPELPDYKIFEDGSIFNSHKGTGGFRFITCSKSSDDKGKQYKNLCCPNKTYKLHRVVCYAFHPKEGFNCLDDYKGYEVNHIDGNTLNNHKDNLEWVSKSQNINHAYEQKLNKKVRAVQQYVLNPDGTQGELIKEFESIAQASRETNIHEQIIRYNAKGKRPPKNFIWKYKNEDETEEWKNKYSSGK